MASNGAIPAVAPAVVLWDQYVALFTLASRAALSLARGDPVALATATITWRRHAIAVASGSDSAVFAARANATTSTTGKNWCSAINERRRRCPDRYRHCRNCRNCATRSWEQ